MHKALETLTLGPGKSASENTKMSSMLSNRIFFREVFGWCGQTDTACLGGKCCKSEKNQGLTCNDIDFLGKGRT